MGAVLKMERKCIEYYSGLNLIAHLSIKWVKSELEIPLYYSLKQEKKVQYFKSKTIHRHAIWTENKSKWSVKKATASNWNIFQHIYHGHFKNAFEYINTHYDVQLDYEKQACEFSDTNLQCIKERCTFYTGIWLYRITGG